MNDKTSLENFWNLVDVLNWKEEAHNKKDKHRFGRLKKTFMQRVALEDLESYRKTLNQLYRALEKAIDDHCEKTGDHLGVSDDSHSDLLHHIIGLGKHLYDKTLKDPSFAVAMAENFDYVESFAYVFPYESDYKNRGNVAPFQDWARRNVEKYNAIAAEPLFATIKNDVFTVTDTMNAIIRGDVKAFFDNEERVTAAAERVDSYVTSVLEKLRSIDSNQWMVKNLYSDAKESLS